MRRRKIFLGDGFAPRSGFGSKTLVCLGPFLAQPEDSSNYMGLKLEEAAEVLGVSKATATRWWTYARA